MASYTLRRSGASLPTVTASLSGWGITDDSVRLAFASRATDTLTFTVADRFDASDTFPYGATVELLRDGVRVFHGRVTSMPRAGAATSESVAVEAAGPWWYLEHLVYEQLWRVPDTSPGAPLFATVERPLTRVIIGRALGSEKITAAAMITEVFQFLADKIPGAPVALGTLHTSLAAEIPTEEVRDLTCAEVLLRVLRWFPAIEPRWDLAAGTPTLHFHNRGDLRLALNHAADPIADLSLKPRPDLRPSCVLIRYQRANEQAGAAGVEIIEDKYPAAADEYALDALRLVVELEGGSGSIQTQYIRTALIATHDPAWWKRHLPALKSDKVSNLTVVAGSNSVVKDEDAEAGDALYNYEIVDGAIPWWKTYRETPAIAAATLTYTVTLDSGATETRTDLARIRIRTTDAETGTYSYAGDYRAPEPVPSGLAQRYFTALSPLMHEGFITHAPTEWDGVNRTGWLVDLPGFPARTDWASLGAPVSAHTVDLASGKSRLTLGPAKHLAPDDWVSLARPARGVTHATRPLATTRSTGRYVPASGSSTATTPAAASGSPRATPSVLPLHPSGAGASATKSAFPFEVFAEPIVPPPTSGATHALKIRLGRVNEVVATVTDDGTITTHMAVVSMPGTAPAASSLIRPGAWKYLYVEVTNGPLRALIKSGDGFDFDGDERKRIPIAAVRAQAAPSGTYGYETLQIASGDQTVRFPLPFEVSPAVIGGERVLRMEDGRATIACADIAHAELFQDASSFAGQKTYTYTLPALRANLPGAGTKSLWIAFEYPKKSARLSAAKWGKLQYTETREMPPNIPWVVVAEKNTNAEAARNSTTDNAVNKNRTQPQGSAGAGTPPSAGAKSSAEVEAELSAMAIDPGDSFSFSSALGSPTNMDIGWATVEVIWRYYTWSVTRVVAGVVHVVKSGMATGVHSARLVATTSAQQAARDAIGANWYLRYNTNSSYSLLPNSQGRWPGPVGRIINGAVASVLYSVNGTSWSATQPPTGYYIIQGGVRVASIAAGVNISVYQTSNEVGDAQQVSGSSSAVLIASVPSGEGGESFTTDQNGKNPYSDNPGRNTPPISDTPPDPTEEVVASFDAAGAQVKAPGPGVWVYEIARVHPNGRVEQRHTGDIILHPTPQVQLRTNPKIAALP